MNLWYDEPLIAIIISISLVLVFLLYNFFNWQKRKKKNTTSKLNLKQFYLDLTVLMISFVLLVCPLFILLF